MTGWTAGAANQNWSRSRQHDGNEIRAVRAVLAEFRRAHGWQPGMVWNPYAGMYELPGAVASPLERRGGLSAHA